MELRPQQIIARYRLTEPLGQGGMGVVWRADDLELHRPVALKFLNEVTLGGEEAQARFLREARTAASLNHPGICTIYEVGQFTPEGHSKTRQFIAMELVEGSTLHALLKDQGRLPVGTLQQISIQAAEALAAAHAAGIVHRDLKPGNIMITPDGRVKILDFGLAKPQAAAEFSEDDATVAASATPATRQGTIVGTLAYISPEQAEGKPVDSRSDVFSFGAMLYELATGRLPFRGDTPTATLAKVLEVEPEPPASVREDLPLELSRVMQRCLRKRPEDRYNDTRDLVAALRETRDTSTGTHAAAQASATPARGRRRWGGGLALLALVVVLIAVAYFNRPGRDEASAPAAVSSAPSIAVLPFDNLSAQAENEYFAAGMTEEIISKLSRLDGLQIASRSSVAPYKDTELDARSIADELGVRYLLEGSVRRAGERVKITAQLVDSTTGFQVWSEEFEGTLEDVFRIQEQTALEIANQLDLELSPQEARAVQERSTDNPDAYDAYLRAQILLTDWSDRNKVEAARRHLLDALAEDPDYPLALAGLASVEAQIYRNFTPEAALLERAAKNAERAFELDPQLPRATMALAEIAGMRFDYHEASRLFEELTRLTPDDPFAWDLLSWTLAYQQPPDAEGAVRAAREALRMQPNFPGAYYHLGRGLLYLGRNEEARDAFQRALEQNPDFTAGHMGLAQYHLAVGEHDQALEELEKSDKETAMAKYYTACILADGGDSEGALAALSRSMEMGMRDFPAIAASPYFEELRADPRLEELLDSYRE